MQLILTAKTPRRREEAFKHKDRKAHKEAKAKPEFSSLTFPTNGGRGLIVN